MGAVPITLPSLASLPPVEADEKQPTKPSHRLPQPNSRASASQNSPATPFESNTPDETLMYTAPEPSIDAGENALETAASTEHKSQRLGGRHRLAKPNPSTVALPGPHRREHRRNADGAEGTLFQRDANAGASLASLGDLSTHQRGPGAPPASRGQVAIGGEEEWRGHRRKKRAPLPVAFLSP